MNFATRRTSETVVSREHLVALISGALREKKEFQLRDGDKRFLEVGGYSDEGVSIALHRGKKWGGWLSPPVTAHDEICQIFAEYYDQGDLPDNRLTNKSREWMEFAAFHPAVYVIVGVIMLGALIYFCFFKFL